MRNKTKKIIIALGLIFAFLSINSYNIFNNQREYDGGIQLRSNCVKNTISGNTANNNGDQGILLKDICNDNIVSRNNTSSNDGARIRV